MKISLPTQILIAIALAIACGMIFGEWMGVLRPVGQAFVMLLKMAILPYIMFALMHGIGSLNPGQARRLLKFGGIFLVAIWAVVFTTIILLRFSFPPLTGMLYYSAGTGPKIERRPLLDLFIPENIFESLSQNIVPAVVLFSLFCGAALMVLRRKEAALAVLETATHALSRITRWVIQISPIGVFALIASTTGTITFVEFEKIAIYLATFFIASLFLTFIALPLLLSSLTPITYKKLLKELREALLLAFSTGNIFVSLPYIMDAIDHLSKEKEISPHESASVTRTLVPIAYNLPLVGNLMAVLFILFLAYYYGIDFTLVQQIMLVPASLLTLAGPVTAGLNAIAFMIEEMRLPTDGLGLFVETLSVTRNFQALAGAMGIAIFALLTLFAFSKQLRFRPHKLILSLGGSAVLLIAILLGLRFGEPVPRPPPVPFPNFKIASDIPTKIYRPDDTLPEPLPAGSTLEQIHKGRPLRVGYSAQALPFSYFNQSDELVGFDIAYAYALAKALNTTLEFIPLDYDNLAGQLDARIYDIGVSTITVTPDRLETVDFTTPTTTLTHVFVVPDADRKKFAYQEKVQEMKNLRIGVLAGTVAEEQAKTLFPNATIVPLPSNDAYLDDPSLDAMFWSDVEALTWVKLHPKYTIVEVIPPLSKEFYAYAVRKGDEEFLQYVNYWLNLQKLSGFEKSQYDKWILGQTGKKPKRWSVVHNVFGW